MPVNKKEGSLYSSLICVLLFESEENDETRDDYDYGKNRQERKSSIMLRTVERTLKHTRTTRKSMSMEE